MEHEGKVWESSHVVSTVGKPQLGSSQPWQTLNAGLFSGEHFTEACEWAFFPLK